jgi:hypothetical protein
VISVVAKSPGMMILHEFHIVRPVIERVHDPRTLVDAVSGLDQGIDAVIVELGPSADHVDDMNVGGVKMEAGAALCLGALARGTHQLHQNFAVGGRGNPRIPVNEERA